MQYLCMQYILNLFYWRTNFTKTKRRFNVAREGQKLRSCYHDCLEYDCTRAWCLLSKIGRSAHNSVKVTSFFENYDIIWVLYMMTTPKHHTRGMMKWCRLFFCLRNFWTSGIFSLISFWKTYDHDLTFNNLPYCDWAPSTL